jgi:hypothetical protein
MVFRTNKYFSNSNDEIFTFSGNGAVGKGADLGSYNQQQMQWLVMELELVFK